MHLLSDCLTGGRTLQNIAKLGPPLQRPRRFLFPSQSPGARNLVARAFQAASGQGCSVCLDPVQVIPSADAGLGQKRARSD